MSKPQQQAELIQALNTQTGRLSWPELARYFARGVVVVVAPDEDLLHVAQQVVADNSDAIGTALTKGAVCRANDQHAKRWQDRQTEFWAVVVAPWVFVQEHH